jgi:hypothetical protein
LLEYTSHCYLWYIERLTYFTNVEKIIDHYTQIVGWRDRSDLVEQRNFYLCVIYVLEECPRQMLTEWWRHEIPVRLLGFFEILRDCIESFEYQHDKFHRIQKDKTVSVVFLPLIILVPNPHHG